jgi:predicted ATP-binding protein involved in virulence
MKIHTLEVSNFHGFEHKIFRLSPGFNVLVGDNGTGKTGVLEALAVAGGALLIGFQHGYARYMELDDTYRKGSEVEGVLHSQRSYPVVVTSDGTLFRRKKRWSRSLDGASFTPTTSEDEDIQRLSKRIWDSRLKPSTRDLPVLAYYGTRRRWPKGKVRQSISADEDWDERVKTWGRLVGYIDCLNSNREEELLGYFLETIADAEEGSEQLDLKLIDDTIRTTLPSFRRVFFEQAEKRLFVELDDSRLLPLDLLPEGYRVAISMVADITLRAALLNPHFGLNAPARTDGLVLIDEIDLHLHPKWQRRIVEDLKTLFPRVQFVTTTHSPFIIQSLREGELINLDPKVESTEYVGRSIEDITENNMGVPVPQRSLRHEKMMQAAEEYYMILRQLQDENHPDVQRLKRRLDELLEPFADDPAYQAFLKIERMTVEGGKEESS